MLIFCSILFLTTVSAVHSAAIDITDSNGWTQLPGTAEQISAKGKQLFGINKYSYAITWNDGVSEYFSYHLKHIAASGGSGTTWGIGFNGRDDGKVWMHSDTTNEWTKVPGFIQNINAAGDHVVGADKDGYIRQFDGSQWVDLPGKPKGYLAAVGEDGEIWMLDFSNNIYRLNGEKWDQQPDTAIYVDVQNAARVVVTDPSHIARFWDGTNWKTLEGQECVQATVNFEAVYCINAAGSVFKYEI